MTPTIVKSQAVIDSTIVSKSDIRTSNQIFAEHAAFLKTVKEQESFIHSLTLINNETTKQNNNLKMSLKLKDSLNDIQTKRFTIKLNDCEQNAKNAKNKTFVAYVVASISTLITILVLAK